MKTEVFYSLSNRRAILRKSTQIIILFVSIVVASIMLSCEDLGFEKDLESALNDKSTNDASSEKDNNSGGQEDAGNKGNDGDQNEEGSSQSNVIRKISTAINHTSISFQFYPSSDSQETQLQIIKVGDVGASDAVYSWGNREYIKRTFGMLEPNKTYEFIINYINNSGKILYTRKEKYKTLATDLSYLLVYDEYGNKEIYTTLVSATEQVQLYNQAAYQSSWSYEKSLVFRSNNSGTWIGFYIDSPYFDGYPKPSTWQCASYEIYGGWQAPYYKVSCLYAYNSTNCTGAYSGTLTKGVLSQGKCYYHFEGKRENWSVDYIKLHFVEDF